MTMPETRHRITPTPTAGTEGRYYDAAGNGTVMNPDDPNNELLVAWFTVAEMADYYDQWSAASYDSDEDDADPADPPAPRFADLNPERQQEVERVFKGTLTDLLADFSETIGLNWQQAGL